MLFNANNTDRLARNFSTTSVVTLLYYIETRATYSCTSKYDYYFSVTNAFIIVYE